MDESDGGLRRVAELLYDASVEDLDRVTKWVSDRRAVLTSEMKSVFRHGDRVVFQGRKSGAWKGIVEGRIEKMNPKRAKVATTHPYTGRRVCWTVPYTMLEKATTLGVDGGGQ